MKDHAGASISEVRGFIRLHPAYIPRSLARGCSAILGSFLTPWVDAGRGAALGGKLNCQNHRT
jgi:hypothetical protein